jgi:hypothetical protein
MLPAITCAMLQSLNVAMLYSSVWEKPCMMASECGVALECLVQYVNTTPCDTPGGAMQYRKSQRTSIYYLKWLRSLIGRYQPILASGPHNGEWADNARPPMTSLASTTSLLTRLNRPVGTAIGDGRLLRGDPSFEHVRCVQGGTFVASAFRNWETLPSVSHRSERLVSRS